MIKRQFLKKHKSFIKYVILFLCFYDQNLYAKVRHFKKYFFWDTLRQFKKWYFEDCDAKMLKTLSNLHFDVLMHCSLFIKVKATTNTNNLYLKIVNCKGMNLNIENLLNFCHSRCDFFDKKKTEWSRLK